jgi:tripartite-type tricarboxylate transporter receptor subunit TctC
MKSRTLAYLLLTIMLVSAAPALGQAKYPAKPVQLVVAYGPGGAQDIFWRSIKEELEKNVKVPISVVNKPGAAGALGADFVSTAKNDGYTLLGAATVIKTVVPAVDPKAARDVDVLALCFRTPTALAVRSESNFKSLKDVVAYAKEKPGALTCATQGVQSEAYFNLELICSNAGIKMTHVPNPNATDAIANVLGGHVDFWLGSLPGILPLAKGGKLRILGFTGERRLPDNPDLPTFSELGFPQANLDFTAALMGPKDLPPEVYTIWQNALKIVLSNPETQASLRKSSMYVELELDRQKINRIIKDQYDRVYQIAIREGITIK